MRPEVYFEVSCLQVKPLTGIGRFVARLIAAVNRIAPVRLVAQFPCDFARVLRMSSALCTGQEIVLPQGTLTSPDEDVAEWTRRLFLHDRHRHSVLRAHESTCLYTMLRPAIRHFRREFCVLYDFTPVLLPSCHVQETRQKFGAFFAQGLAGCDGAIAISQSTRADAVWMSALDASRISVGYPGPSLCEHRHAWNAPVTRSRRQILVASTVEPRKNAQFLMDWFAQSRAIPDDFELLWVGPGGWYQEQQKRSAGKRRVEFLGMIPDRELCRLYRQAAFTIYPSLYEGFGFPVLDSLRHGAPVVCGYNSSLAEFEGPGVHYFDVCDPASLDHACNEVLNTPTFERSDLDSRFAWNRLADTVLELAA